MKLTWQPLTLNLKTTFHIAHGATDQRFNVLVRLVDEKGGGLLEGLGEAAAVPYYGESREGIISYLECLSGTPSDPSKIDDPYKLDHWLSALPPGSAAARTALDIALHDLLGKNVGQPLYRLFGLDPSRAPQTSFTIAIDKPEVMAERARLSGMPIIKVKLGGETDLESVAAIRAVTDARIRLDANSAWTREQAAYLIPRLLDYDIEFIEQPLGRGDLDGLRWLHDQKFGVPIFVDENVLTARDIAPHAGLVEGVVIKLMKAGGIRNALRAIHVAKALDLQVMIGCMVESSLGVSAAAHLSPLCDYADLDSPLLIKNDPFLGIQYTHARLLLPDKPGLGVDTRKNDKRHPLHEMEY